MRREHEDLLSSVKEMVGAQRHELEQMLTDAVKRERHESRSAVDAKLEAVQMAVEALQVAHEAEQKRNAARAAHVDRLLRQGDRSRESFTKELEKKLSVRVLLQRLPCRCRSPPLVGRIGTTGGAVEEDRGQAAQLHRRDLCTAGAGTHCTPVPPHDVR